MEIKRATNNDIEQITQLLRENATSSADISFGTLQHVYMAFTKNGELAGVGAMQIFDDAAFLHTLVVGEAFRAQGFGYLLMKTLDHAAKTENVDEIYLLSDGLSDYFKRYGYEAIDESVVPASISGSSVYQQLHGSAGTTMRLRITVTS